MVSPHFRWQRKNMKKAIASETIILAMIVVMMKKKVFCRLT